MVKIFPNVRNGLCAAALTCLVGCPPTLSRPHSETHLDAMAEGGRHMRHGRDEQAAEAFDRGAQTADRRVDQDEARYRQSRALEDAGRDEEALVILDAIGNRQPPSRRTARALYDGAKIRLRLGQDAMAYAGFERVIREHPDTGLGPRSLTLLLRAREEPAEARIAWLEGIYPEVRESEMGDDILAAMADVFRVEEDETSLRATLERMVADHPYPQGHRWDDAILELVALDRENGESERALERLEAMLERHETTQMVGTYTLHAFPEAQRLRAEILHRDLGRTREAIREYETLIETYEHSTIRDDAMLARAELLFASDEQAACDGLTELLESYEVGRAHRRAETLFRERCPGELPTYQRDED